MNFVKLELDINYGNYMYRGASNSELEMLGFFLIDAIGHSKEDCQFFKKWALADKEDPKNPFNYSVGTNATYLEEDDNGDIHIIDDTGSDPDDMDYIPAEIKMTRKQFVQLLDDWVEKVCKLKPKKVIIKYDNDQFVIETNG